jgi:hypothetical protein
LKEKTKKIQHLMIQKRKRGRPPKNKNINVLVVAPEIVKRKRGRPPKNLATINVQDLPKKRGRPKKAASVASVSKPPKDITKNSRQLNENFVVGKMFIHSKKVSKQEPWFDSWYQSLWDLKAKKDWSSLLVAISHLQEGLNKILNQEDDVKLSVHIPLLRLMQDEEIMQVLFDPLNKGVDVKVYFRAKDFPLGLSPSMKATAVCNKLTEIIKSSVPVGVSG